jgi:membrane fusion protein, multidrug efflux system
MIKQRIKMLVFTAVIIGTAASLTACFDKDKHKKKAVHAGVPVSVVKAVNKEIIVKYKSVGTVSSPKNPVIRSQVSGHLKSIDVTEGQTVKRGQTLAVIDKEHELVALNQAEAQFLRAKAVFEERRSQRERKEKLVVKGIISKLEYNSAIAGEKVAKANLEVANNSLYNAQYNLAKTDVISPINGVVEKVSASVGDVVGRNTALMQLINHDKLRVTLPFSQDKANLLKAGQKIKLKTPVMGEGEVKTKISTVVRAVNVKSRAFNVIVEFDNVNNWVAGTSINGEVSVGKPFKSITVPAEALVLRPGGVVVFVVKKGKAYEKRVVVGYQTGNEVAIYQGLKAGDLVVTNGATYLGNGTPVDIKR